jgi:UDP-galactopyranose mutase
LVYFKYFQLLDFNKNFHQALRLNEKKKNIYFEGRLAKYKYFNTDEVIENALTLFNQLKIKYKKN